jgi:cell division protein FtsL
MTTTDAIRKALTDYRRDQVAVIHQMARERGMDERDLSVAQYRYLILEEASWSEKASRATCLPADEREMESRYAAKLRSIASNITTSEKDHGLQHDGGRSERRSGRNREGRKVRREAR